MLSSVVFSTTSLKTFWICRVEPVSVRLLLHPLPLQSDGHGRLALGLFR